MLLFGNQLGGHGILQGILGTEVQAGERRNEPPGMARDWLNSNYPTGLAHQWDFSKDEKFTSGEPNPCPCEQESGRTHYLFDC